MPAHSSTHDNGHSREAFVPFQTAPGGLSPRQRERLRAYTAASPIIVTDDDVMSRGLIRAILNDLTVIFIRDAAEVLDICHRHPISLIISDIRKPRMNGLQMLECLRADPAIAHIPVIFVTGSSNTEALAYEMGADGHMMKPFHPNALLAEIWRVLSDRIK